MASLGIIGKLLLLYMLYFLRKEEKVRFVYTFSQGIYFCLLSFVFSRSWTPHQRSVLKYKISLEFKLYKSTNHGDIQTCTYLFFLFIYYITQGKFMYDCSDITDVGLHLECLFQISRQTPLPLTMLNYAPSSSRHFV